jgi:hypothetical protein
LLALEPGSPVDLYLHLARVTLAYGPDPIRIRRKDYVAAFDRELALTLAKHELPGDRWRVAIVDITPAGRSHRLQIADLISHASHDNFSACDKRTKEVLQKAFGAFDMALALPIAIEQAERSLVAGAAGVALQMLAEREIRGKAGYARRVSRDLVTRCLDALVTASSETRDDHLSHLLAWVRLLVHDARNIDLAVEACDWITKSVERPLLAQLGSPADIAWFGFALRAWLLTAYNHAGQIAKGTEVAAVMSNDFGILAGRWEHAPTLLGGALTLAVHNTDCRNFDDAIVQADKVAAFYGDMTALFWDALPGAMTRKVRSTQRGKALGTGLQARLHRGLKDADAIAEARRISDAALEEFAPGSGQVRQHQYRTFLETLAGDYAAARRHLGFALNVPAADDGAPDHTVLAAVIAACGTEQRAFPLLHWIRIGAAAQQAGEKAEATAFRLAFDHAALCEDPWCGGIDRFPSHAILFHLATFEVASGNMELGIKLLQNLASLKSAADAPALAVIVIGAFARIAALMWREREARARQLLTLPRKSLAAFLNEVRQPLTPFPAIRALVGDLDAILSDLAPGGIGADIPARLNAIAGRIVI